MLTQQYTKYLKLAKEAASTSGDRSTIRILLSIYRSLLSFDARA